MQTDLSKDATISYVADRLVEARDKERGMSKAELARRIDASSSAVLRWEEGTNEIPLHRLLQVADALDKDLAFFLQDFSDKLRVADQLREKWLPARENGDRSEMSVRLKDLVEEAPECSIYVGVSRTPVP